MTFVLLLQIVTLLLIQVRVVVLPDINYDHQADLAFKALQPLVRVVNDSLRESGLEHNPATALRPLSFSSKTALGCFTNGGGGVPEPVAVAVHPASSAQACDNKVRDRTCFFTSL